MDDLEDQFLQGHYTPLTDEQPPAKKTKSGKENMSPDEQPSAKKVKKGKNKDTTGKRGQGRKVTTKKPAKNPVAKKTKCMLIRSLTFTYSSRYSLLTSVR